MKTTKQTFAALLIIAALALFSGSLAYSQGECTEDAHHRCGGGLPGFVGGRQWESYACATL